ncbi:MAG: hypothetical protein SCJ94_09405 [Bacillota bacterium]|nr:periplasmic heavy metal sensor [Bacillota bacterium]MDW7730203.1 hypothetical protein [Bacillota bacterium]
MKKSFLTMAVVTMSILILSSGAFAFGGGFGQGRNDTCIQDNLTPEQQTQFEKVMETFRFRMQEIRDKISEARENGDVAAFENAKSERLQLMEAKRESLSEIAPEFAEQFQNCGRNMRNNSWEKGSGGFNR